MIRSRGVGCAIVLALAACAGGDPASEAGRSTTTAATSGGSPSTDASTSTTAPPDFTGDAGSVFCQALIGAEGRPVLDPFEAGLEPREVELRLRALVLRFEELSGDAPSELADDVRLVATALASVDDALARHGYDFAAAADAGVDLSFADAPEFVDVSARLSAYRTQVCRDG